MRGPGFWLKDTEFYDVTMMSHIRFVLDNSEIFKCNKKELLKIYKKYKEPIGFEGHARKEIIQKLFKMGWIRIRFHGYWKVECDSVEKRKKIILDFFNKLGNVSCIYINDEKIIIGG